MCTSLPLASERNNNKKKNSLTSTKRWKSSSVLLLQFHITGVSCVSVEGEVCFPWQFKHAQVSCLLSSYVLLVCSLYSLYYPFNLFNVSLSLRKNPVLTECIIVHYWCYYWSLNKVSCSELQKTHFKLNADQTGFILCEPIDDLKWFKQTNQPLWQHLR